MKKDSLEDNEIVAYTDGSCLTNPGFAGWGVYLRKRKGDKVKCKKISGAHPRATNNMMEMQAAIEALKATNPNKPITIYTDSQYVQKGITSWVFGWEKRNYQKADGTPVKNAELWRELRNLSKGRDVVWKWVRGHNGNHGNEMADVLARTAAEDLRDKEICKEYDDEYENDRDDFYYTM